MSSDRKRLFGNEKEDLNNEDRFSNGMEYMCKK